MARFNIDFDFGDLPAYIVREIKNSIGEDFSYTDRDLSNWKLSFIKFIDTVANEHRLNMLMKSVEYGNACLNYHKDVENCHKPNCQIEENTLRRLAVVDNLLSRAKQEDKNLSQISATAQSPQKRDFTTARQVLAMHYIFAYLKVKNIDISEKARFIEFITGKNYKNIYDAVSNPLTTKNKSFRKEDLTFVRTYFEKLEMMEIVKMINNELDTPLG